MNIVFSYTKATMWRNILVGVKNQRKQKNSYFLDGAMSRVYMGPSK